MRPCASPRRSRGDTPAGKDKSVFDMEGLDVMNTDDPGVYWYWLDMEDTMVAKPGEPTNLERNVTTGAAIRWAEVYEEDRRNLNEVYRWHSIEEDTPIAQVMGATNGHRAHRPVTTGMRRGCSIIRLRSHVSRKPQQERTFST